MSRTEYVIYLSDNSAGNSNVYGYWDNSSYRVDGEVFPVHVMDKKDLAHRWKTRKGAERAAKRAMDTYGYVRSAKVEEIEVNEDENTEN